MNKKWMWFTWVLIGVLMSVSLLTPKKPNITQTKVMLKNDEVADTITVDTIKYYHEAIEHLKQHEGFRSTVYKDVDGAETIGYGHHLLEGEDYNNISEATATEILKNDFNYRYNVVKAKYSVNYTQALALTLFSFNLGLGGLQNAINNGMLDNIESIKQYCHYSTYVNGKRQIHKSKRLLERRKFELRLFLINY